MGYGTREDLKIVVADLSTDSAEFVAAGTSAWVLRGGRLDLELFLAFGAFGLCLKIFFHPAPNPVDTLWEGVPVWETAVVQNLFADEGMAPRVYGFVALPGGMWGEAVEYAGDEPNLPERLFERFMGVARGHNIHSNCLTQPGGRVKWDAFHTCAITNWRGDWFLDWGGKYRAELYPELEREMFDYEWERDCEPHGI